MRNWTGFFTHLKRESLRFFKVPNNTIIPSLVSVFLYIVIFGAFLGSRIKEIEGIPYIQFLVPGLILMNIIMGSYMNPSGSLFMARWAGNIEDLLVSPVSYFQMVMAYILGGMARGFALGAGTLIIAIIFAKLTITNIFVLLVYVILSSFIFSCFGIFVGLWADKWEQLNIFLNFLITPLTFLGGVFFSIKMIPESIQFLAKYNPIFYMIDGARYGMIGYHEGSFTIGISLLIFLSVLFFLVLVYLFRKGWKLRN